MSLNTMATVQRASFLAVSKLPSSSSSSLLPSSSSSSSGLSSYVSFSRHKGMNRNLLSKTKRLLSFSSSSSLVNRNPYITTTPVDCLATPLSKESKDLSPSSSASQDHKLSNSGLLLSSSSSSPSRHNSTYLSRQSLHTLSLLKRTSGEEETHYSHLHAKFTRKARIRRTLHPSFFFTSLPSVRSRPTPCTPLLSSSSSLSSSFPNLTTPASQTKHVSYYSVSQKAFFSTSRGNTRGGGEGDSSEKTTNPYAILGCSPSSTPQEIKKKFRELAKKYHPDLNPDPAAKQKMAEVAAAYELLSDPKQREFYDKTGMTPEQAAAAAAAAGGAGGGPHPGAGHGPGGFDASFMFTDFAEMFANMAGFGSATGGMGGSFTSTTFTSGGAESGTAAVRGDDIQTEVTIELLEAIQGCEKTLRFSAKCSCPSCSGTGSSTGSSGIQRCRACGGSGVQRIDRGPIVLGIPCRQCNGGGQVITHPCRTCRGTGVKSQSKVLNIDIPKGVREGMQMRVPNQGHMGYRGGKPGHLFVVIHIKPHEIFKWVDDDIHVDVPLSIKQCLLGGKIDVPTVEGGRYSLFVPPGTNPSTVKILKGKGPPKIDHSKGHRHFGNLVLHFVLKVPTSLTPQQRRCIEIFDQIENSPNKGGSHEDLFSSSSSFDDKLFGRERNAARQHQTRDGVGEEEHTKNHEETSLYSSGGSTKKEDEEEEEKKRKSGVFSSSYSSPSMNEASKERGDEKEATRSSSFSPPPPPPPPPPRRPSMMSRTASSDGEKKTVDTEKKDEFSKRDTIDEETKDKLDERKTSTSAAEVSTKEEGPASEKEKKEVKEEQATMNGELRKEEEKEDAEEQMKITGDEKHEEKEGKYRHPSVDTMKTDLKIEEESNEEKKKEQTISL